VLALASMVDGPLEPSLRGRWWRSQGTSRIEGAGSSGQAKFLAGRGPLGGTHAKRNDTLRSVSCED